MLTSIVHEFAVLYSSRVHQKDKKWSDGRLKYYEFNRKIEILSDEMILVSSDFYPSGGKPPLECGVFEDGNTYKLPNGKLVVEFAEYLGCKERDILKMFLKQEVKKEHSAVVPERAIKVEFPAKTGALSAAASINRPMVPRVGLRRPKRPTKQLEVTLFVLKLSVEEKLAMYARKWRPVGLRIPVGSNRMSTRLYKELGIDPTPKVAGGVEGPVSMERGDEGGMERRRWEEEER